jgi:hypothetical protein
MKKLIVPALAALLATSSFAFAQTGSTGTAPMEPSTTTTTTTGAVRDPGVNDRNARQESVTRGDSAGSGTPGSRTTGAGISPSDRATGADSGK